MFTCDPIGLFHPNIAEVRTEEGKLYLFVAIDRASKFAAAQLVEKANHKAAWKFPEHLPEAVPYKIHTIQTARAIENGISSSPMASNIQFAEQRRNQSTAYSLPMQLNLIRETNGIEHRMTKPNHPWCLENQKAILCTFSPTKGQLERTNRTFKHAMAERYHYDNFEATSRPARTPITSHVD